MVHPTNAVFTNAVASPDNTLNGLRRACIGWRVTDTALGSWVANDVSTQAVFTVTTNLTLTWFWTNEYQLAISAALNGAVNSGTKNGWYTNGTEVSGLLATPDPDYYFAGWLGSDVPSGQELVNPLTVTMDRTRTNIMAEFATTSTSAVTRTWTGIGNWLSHTNWSPAGIPGSNDYVIIKSGTLLISIPSTIGSLFVSNGAALVFSNWNACLSMSGNSIIQSNGMLSLSAAFTTNQMSNRIWVTCADFTLQAGGSIVADACGYANDNGPGRGITGGGCSGGGYGGKGGNGSSGAVGGSPYGSSNAPIDPGSGGPIYGGLTMYIGTHGGGAILIEASGNLSLYGTVSANGGRIGGPDPSNYGAGASGGSIYLICGSFAGNSNTIMRANGGNGGTFGGGGGGGRAAVWIGVQAASRNQYLSSIPGRVVRTDVAPETYPGIFSATNGTGWQNGNTGTFFFFTVPPEKGSIITLR